MSLRNCSQCGMLFSSAGRNICSKCLDKEEEDYKLVRKFVRDHPGASVFEVSEETGIEEDKIMQFIRDGRLVSQGFTGALACESCGKSINTGRFCADCTQKRDKEIMGLAPRKAAPEQPKPPVSSKRSEKMYVRE